MNKEEIREGIANIGIGDVYDGKGNRIASMFIVGDEGTDKILSFLDPYVKIVKEIELPECPYGPAWTEYERSIYKQAQQDMLQWHNESLERLI